MIPKQTIEKAIEGGWKYLNSYEFGDRRDFPLYAVDETKSPQVYMVDWHMVVLDPTFWQALGKSLGWRKAGIRSPSQGRMKDGKWFDDEWFINAHRLYDLILTGGDTEKFWNELLN